MDPGNKLPEPYLLVRKEKWAARLSMPVALAPGKWRQESWVSGHPYVCSEAGWLHEILSPNETKQAGSLCTIELANSLMERICC